MTLHKCFDAAFPPATAPPGCDSVLGYIGGNATHVWSPAEWRRFGHLRQFPAWVCYQDPAGPAAQAQAAAAAAAALGWAANYQPQLRVIIADLETFADRTWYLTFTLELAARGFGSVAYGSMSTVLANAATMVWAADFNFVPQLEAGQTIEATQYADNVAWEETRVDYSVVSDSLFVRGGVGPRS